jgi:hypothetical protein
MNDEPMSDAKFEKWVVAASAPANFPYDLALSIVITDDRRLRAKVKRLEAEIAADWGEEGMRHER